MTTKLLNEKEIIKGVISGDIKTKTYDFKDIDFKKETLAKHLECSVDEITYNKKLNRFVFGSEQYHVLHEDEVAIQKIINIYDNIRFETFFIGASDIGSMLDISKDEIRCKHAIREGDNPIPISRVYFRSNLSLSDFISKVNSYYSNVYFLAYDTEEVKKDDLYIYLYGV